MEIFFEIHSGLPREAPGDNEATRRAYAKLKDLPLNPKILDVGCGPGMQTIEIAKLTNGRIIALDNHQPFLDELERRAKIAGVEKKIELINCSMFSMDFDQNAFDIIWSEGAIYIYGFEAGLKDWRYFLKSNGYIVVTEISWLKDNQIKELREFWNNAYPDIKSIEENLKIIDELNYRLIDYFVIPESSWWKNYYIPLEKRVIELRKKYHDNIEINEVLNEELREINMYKKYSDYYGYVFYIIKNKVK